MHTYPSQIKLLLKRLLLLYFLYFLCRLFFFLTNRTFFPEVGWMRFIADSFYGIRFDSFSIAAGNCLFILLSLLPPTLFLNKFVQFSLKFLFIFINALFLLPNCIDMAYFSFTRKRSGSDLFHQVSGQTDLAKLLPRYLIDFWWALLIFSFLIFLLFIGYKKIKQKTENSVPEISKLRNVIVVLLVLSLTALSLRGGWQRNPISIVDAGGMSRPEDAPLVLNTSFTLIKSLGEDQLKVYDFYTERELKTVFYPVHHYADSSFKKMNVVVIILESFAKEYTSLGKTISYTPFLDSLMKHSLVFTNGIANGSKSIEGIPAILSSIPSMMENPFINSSYSNNFQSSFATILSKEGYNCSFFHGGINGTMNFDTYARLAGYQNYFGRNEYGNEKDFDGYWGIWDEPYLQYTVKKMSEFKEPFHSSIFTLSSHHPYKVPEKYKGRFPKGHMENLESVGYADHSLRLFFESAKRTSWYTNTLFILSADHCCLSEHPYFKHTLGLKSIPILFYRPDNSLKNENSFTFSQIDILPTALQLTGYNKPFFSLGKSAFHRNNNNCYYYENGACYVVCDSMLCCYNDTKINSIYNVRRDSLLHKNLVEKYPSLIERTDAVYKGFLQVNNQTLLNNSGTIK